MKHVQDAVSLHNMQACVKKLIYTEKVCCSMRTETRYNKRGENNKKGNCVQLVSLNIVTFNLAF
jgi:hypothetical protein